MDEPIATEVRLKLTASEPVSGWLAVQGHKDEPFAGYLELIAALERVRQPAETKK